MFETREIKGSLSIGNRWRRKYTAGFTLTELMFAMAISSVVALSGFALFSSTSKSQLTQEDVGEAQQNLRVAMDRISRDLRVAGFGLPKDSFIPTIDFDTANPGASSFDSPFTIEDNTDGPDSITILGIGMEVGELLGAHAAAAITICYKSTTSRERLLDGTDKTTVVPKKRFISIDGLYMVELATGATGACSVDGVSGRQITLIDELPRDFPTGTLHLVQAITYSIFDGEPDSSQPCTGENPCLRSFDHTGARGTDSEVVAENIEDIQFAYALNADGNKVLDDLDGDGRFDFVDFTTNTDYIAAVRVTIVARSRRWDQNGRFFELPAIENHSPGGRDHYRRRFLTKLVQVRNPRQGREQ